MAEIIKSIFLGILQGLTEFLPVSSSGHLVLAEKLGLGEASLFFNVTLHLGTLGAVFVVYRKKIFDLLKAPKKNKLWLYVLASVPTAALGLVFKKLLPELLIGKYLPLGFMITAVALAAGELVRNDKITGLTAKNAFLTGVAQGLAVFPGISRSGSTITAARLLGMEKTEAADFSFLLSVPVILGSGLLEFYEALSSGAAIQIAPVAAGTAAAFLSGLAALTFMINTVKKHNFWPFAAYTAALSVVSFFVL